MVGVGPLVLVLAAIVSAAELAPVPLDHCAAIAGKEWVSPLEARQCIYSFPVVPEFKDNVRRFYRRAGIYLEFSFT